MEMLALGLSGLCRFLWQITEIRRRAPTLSLFSLRSQTKCMVLVPKFDPLGQLAGGVVYFFLSHHFKVGKGEGHLALWKEMSVTQSYWGMDVTYLLIAMVIRKSSNTFLLGDNRLPLQGAAAWIALSEGFSSSLYFAVTVGQQSLKDTQ